MGNPVIVHGCPNFQLLTTYITLARAKAKAKVKNS